MKNMQDIWSQFVDELSQEHLTSARLRPYHEALRQPLLASLEDLWQETSIEHWQAEADFHPENGRFHVLVPFTIRGDQSLYCFTFITEGKRWFLQHLESIVLRLDLIGPFPVCTFPDLQENKKAWIREKFRVTHQVQLFRFLRSEKVRSLR